MYNEFKKKHDEWNQKYDESLKKCSQRKQQFTNLSGMSVKPLYSPLDIEGDFFEKLGFPGEYPFTRGIYSGMYRMRCWSKRNLIGFESPETTNRRTKEMINNGMTGVSFVPDQAHVRGYDGDEVERSWVGNCASPAYTSEDIEETFDGIKLDKISFALQDNGPFTQTAWIFNLAQKQGISLSKLAGTTSQSDFISHYVAAHSMLRFPLEGHLRCTIDLIEFCRKHVPAWNPISVVGQHMQQAGATPAQSMAFSLASAVFYLDQCIKAEIDIDSIAKRLSFFHDVGTQIFEEAARFRAQRRMWAKIIKDQFKSNDPRSMIFKFHAQTSGAQLSRQQPYLNLGRTAVQTLAAVLGGVQSLHVDSFDEPLHAPSEEAAKLSMLMQHMIEEETGAADVIDPLGGSYYVEKLTDEMEETAWQYLKKIEDMGGMMEAVKKGFIQEEIGKSAWEYEKALNKGEQVWVGENKYVMPELIDVPQSKVRSAAIDTQLEKLKLFKQNRDNNKTKKALDALKESAMDENINIFEATMHALRDNATHGEVVGVLRNVFGFGKPLLVI